MMISATRLDWVGLAKLMEGAGCAGSCCLVDWNRASTRWAARCHNDPLKNNHMQYNRAVKCGEIMAADGQKPGPQQAGRGNSFIAQSPAWIEKRLCFRPIPGLQRAAGPVSSLYFFPVFTDCLLCITILDRCCSAQDEARFDLQELGVWWIFPGFLLGTSRELCCSSRHHRHWWFFKNCLFFSPVFGWHNLKTIGNGASEEQKAAGQIWWAVCPAARSRISQSWLHTEWGRFPSLYLQSPRPALQNVVREAWPVLPWVLF